MSGIKDDKPKSSCFIKEEVIFAKFDYDGRIFIISTDKGIRVFRRRNDRVEEYCHPNLDKTGTVVAASVCSDLYLSLFVGGKPAPKFPPNCAVAMDQTNHRVLSRIRRGDEIINVLHLKQLFILVTNNYIKIVDVIDKGNGDVWSADTCNNPAGLIAAGDPVHERTIVAFPAITEGQIMIVDATKILKGKPTNAEIIDAHTSTVACIAVSIDNALLASASEKGTIIRVFSTVTKQKIIEFRRGTSTAAVHCLRFSLNNEYLGCSSDNGSIHIFDVARGNRRFIDGIETMSLLRPLTDIRAIGIYRVHRHFKYDLAFGTNLSLNVIGSDGTFRQYLFVDPKTKKVNFLPDPSTFDWILEFCKCDMWGDYYDPPKGKSHPFPRGPTNEQVKAEMGIMRAKKKLEDEKKEAENRMERSSEEMK